jgi:exosortase
MSQTGVLQYEVRRPHSVGEDRYWGLTPTAWLKIGVLAILFIALFRFNLVRLWLKTNPFTGEPNWGHTVVVPLLGLYYLYLNREGMLKRPVKPLLAGTFTRRRFTSAAVLVGAGLALYLVLYRAAPVAFREYMGTLGLGLAMWGVLIAALDWGLGTMVLGLCAFAFGIWPGQNDFLMDVGMVLTLFGLVLASVGWEVMRVVWFPIAFLLCALPWPQLTYSQLAQPLQELAASVSVGVLQMTGVVAQHVGTKIIIGAYPNARELNVAEACAGLRSLMTFITIGAAMAFLSQRPLWQKIVITAMAVPIAILCNVIRVAGQGLLDHYVSQELSKSFAHQFVGLIMLIPAFFLLLLVGWILDRIFVEEADARRLLAAASRRRAQDLVIEVNRGGQAPAAPRLATPVPAVAVLLASRAVAAPRPAPAARPPQVAPAAPSRPLPARSTPSVPRRIPPRVPPAPPSPARAATTPRRQDS